MKTSGPMQCTSAQTPTHRAKVLPSLIKPSLQKTNGGARAWERKMSKGLQMLSKISKAGELELFLTEVDVQRPAKDQVVIRLEAAPINPSDMGPMF